jgi:hypothetical protein
MAYATLDDLLQVEPTIQDYGVLDWEVELARSEVEINRILKVRWYQAYQKQHPRINQIQMDPTLLDPTQFTQATVYHAMAYHITPKLTQFNGAEPDKFQVMMQYYQGRFEHEMDLVLREGVRYDINDDDTLSNDERDSGKALRLVR